MKTMVIESYMAVHCAGCLTNWKITDFNCPKNSYGKISNDCPICHAPLEVGQLSVVFKYYR